MKSSVKDLKRRGFVTDEEIAALEGTPQEILLELLHSENAVTRSAAACNLDAAIESVAYELLKHLSIEKCLYTRIAICETLEKGDCSTAMQMTKYLGKIGKNQHKEVPDKVSDKKSFPLPRDITARSLGKMRADTFPVLLEVLKERETAKIQEVLDAIGFMVFYNPALATCENIRPVLALLESYADNPLIEWKVILCLSSFPITESKTVLLQYAGKEGTLGLEAQRSLNIIEMR